MAAHAAEMSAALPGLAGDLARWVAAGLVSEEQSAAIAAHERARATPAPPTARVPAGVARSVRVPVVGEALGYLGGVLAIVGLVLLVAQYWPDMATAGRLGLSGAAALALLGAGALVREAADPALARLRGFVWLASTAATALFAGVLAADGFDVDTTTTVVLACGGAVTLQSGLLWAWRDRPLQQLAFLAGLAVFAGALVAELAGSGPAGLTVWLLGVAFIVLGARRRTPLPLLTEGAGAIAVVVGAGISQSDWQGFGLCFGVATAFGLLAFAQVPGPAPARADQRMAAIVGGVALVWNASGAIGYFSGDAGAVTGLTTWAVGAVLVVVGTRRLVRAPRLAEVLGAIALLGGAALTGRQWEGFAPIFGIVTAIGLLALGTVPGHVLMSGFGSLGLLVNVPWAIAWFFPGEGRAPLLLLVSGVLILAVAVLLTRMGGRFRRELGGARGDAPRTETAPVGAEATREPR